MTHTEILIKVIEKAEKNGWCGLHSKELLIKHTDSDYYSAVIINNMYRNGIIFSHDFAKAFWGKKIIEDTVPVFIKHENYANHEKFKQVSWCYHLQKMILEKEPLKYLEKFL